MASLHPWLPWLALGPLLVGPAHPAAAGLTLDRVLARGVMVLATDPDDPPRSFRDDGDEFHGLEIEVGREIAERLGVDVEFVTPGADVVAAGQWDGRWDAAIGALVPGADGAFAVDVPAICYRMPAALAVHRDNQTITTPAAASGRRIGVAAGSAYESYLKHDLALYGEPEGRVAFVIDGAQIRPYDDARAALDDLGQGDGVRLDAALAALPTIQEAIKAGDPLKPVGDPLFREPQAIATEKGDEDWNAQLATIVSTMRADGTLGRLSKKWFGLDLSR